VSEVRVLPGAPRIVVFRVMLVLRAEGIMIIGVGTDPEAFEQHYHD
jgi:hypothetical protein